MQYLDCPGCRARFHTGVIYELGSHFALDGGVVRACGCRCRSAEQS